MDSIGSAIGWAVMIGFYVAIILAIPLMNIYKYARPKSKSMIRNETEKKAMEEKAQMQQALSPITNIRDAFKGGSK